MHEHHILRLVLKRVLQQAQIGEEVDVDLDSLLGEKVIELWAVAQDFVKAINLPLHIVILFVLTSACRVVLQLLSHHTSLQLGQLDVHIKGKVHLGVATHN